MRVFWLVPNLALAALPACSKGDLNGAETSAVTFSDNDTEGGTAEGSSDTTGRPDDDTGALPIETCGDGSQNQDESDVDCGGTTCDACEEGDHCGSNDDCQSQSCTDGQCGAASCDNLLQDGDETDVDCGGPCPACPDNQGCVDGDDCESGVCTNEACTPPSCGDGVENGDETDLDCGGSCMGCGEDGVCVIDGDCLSDFCDNEVCAPKACQNDGDCADFDGPCSEGVCDQNAFSCVAEDANEGLDCDDGDLCATGEVCTAGVCGGAQPVDCSNLSDQCNTGACNANSGNCEASPDNEDNACNDGIACTQNEVCTVGVCEDPNAPTILLFEDFADPDPGWTLGNNWEIGPAMASGNCFNGADPSVDHTIGDDNALVGVKIGGCDNGGTHAFYCLTSPTVDASGNGSVWISFWRHLHTDYIPYVTNRLQVWDGASWVILQIGYADPGINDGSWTQVAADVTAFKSNQLRFRVCYNRQIGASNFASWSIDDVLIGPDPADCAP